MTKWMLVLFLLASGPALAQETKERQPQDPAAKKQPSLADLARQSRQRTLTAEKPARSFTNADLARLKGANVSTSSSAEGGPDAQTGEGEAAAESGGESAQEALSPEELEKWKKAFDEARLNLQNAVNEGLVLQLRMNNLRNAFLRQSDGVTQQRVQAQLQETFDRIEKNHRDRRDARSAVEKLQREARDAGLSRSQIEEFTGQLPADPPEILSESTRDSG